ncbi:hypothetical protein BJ742DRAFT_816957 [Cladochytrium replicatum]|nr:hypothetical protein BJ742DRAFT_816957 [Cladochytrium replicatum]
MMSVTAQKQKQEVVHEELYAEHDKLPTGRVIAVAVDASAHSLYAFNYAIENLVTANSSDVVCILNVRAPAQLTSPVLAAPYEDVTEWLDKLEKEAKSDSHDLLRKYGSEVLRRGIHCRAIALRGDPREELVTKLEELKPTIFVIGSRGMGSFKRAVLGSVSDFAVHHAPCPVLVVRETRN